MSTDTWHSDPEVAHAGRRTLRVLMAAQVIGGLGIGAGISVGSLVAEEVAGSEALAGISRTMSTVGTALFAVPLVRLAQRVGRRGALSTGWTLAAVGAVLLVVSLMTLNLAVLMVGMLIYGAGTAANLQSRFAVTDLAPATLRARWLSLVVWSTTVGTVLGPNLAAPGAWLAGHFSLPALSGAYLLAVIGLVAGAAVTWWGLRPDPLLLARQLNHERHREAGTVRPDPLTTRELLAQIAQVPLLWIAIAVVALNQTVMVTMMTMAPVEMAHHDMSLTLIGLSLSLHTLGMFAFSPVVGWMAGRWGERPVLLIGCAITAISLVCSLTAGDSMTLMALGLFLLGLGWSFGMVAGSSLLTSAAPERVRTSAQGLSDTTMNLVAACGAAAAGPVLAVAGYPVLSVIAGVMVVVMTLLVATPRAQWRAAKLDG